MKKIDDQNNPVFDEWFFGRINVTIRYFDQRQIIPIRKKKRSLQSITKDMVVEKFTNIKQNAGVWLRNAFLLRNLIISFYCGM